MWCSRWLALSLAKGCLHLSYLSFSYNIAHSPQARKLSQLLENSTVHLWGGDTIMVCFSNLLGATVVTHLSQNTMDHLTFRSPLSTWWITVTFVPPGIMVGSDPVSRSEALLRMHGHLGKATAPREDVLEEEKQFRFA